MHTYIRINNSQMDIDLVSAGIPQSVLRLCTGWTVRGSNSGGGEFSAPLQTDPQAHPTSYTVCTGSFPEGSGGVKRPGRGLKHLTTSSAEVKERVELHLYSPCVLSWPGLGRPLPLFYLYIDLVLLIKREFIITCFVLYFPVNGS